MSWNAANRYRQTNKAMTSRLTNEEHAEFTELARADGIPATTKATEILRAFLAERRRPLVPDDFEDSPLVYCDRIT